MVDSIYSTAPTSDWQVFADHVTYSVSFNDDHPKRNEMHKRLIRDYEKTGEITLEQTLEKLNKSSEWHGQPNPGALADRAVHADTLSIGYRNVPGRLAEELCEHGMSWGPDWVNELEGKFCDMAEKKLYPVCSQDIKDDCFDMGLKDVVRGGGRFSEYVLSTHEMR